MSDVMKTIAEKWLGPAGIIALLGIVIWLVQMNNGWMEAISKIAILSENDNKIQNTLATVAETQLQQTVILTYMQKDHEAVKKVVSEHNKESEKWKHKIIRCEDRVDNCE